MNAHFHRYICSAMFLCIALLSARANNAKSADVNFKTEIESLLSDRKIEGFYIYYIPISMAFATAVTKEGLISGYKYKLENKDIYISNPSIIGFLSSVGEPVYVNNEGPDFDYRWGFVFYGKDGVELSSIYCDLAFHFGVINGKAFRPSENLKKWALKNLRQAFNIDDE